MTVIEKIIARHSGKNKVHPGDVVWMNIDVRSAELWWTMLLRICKRVPDNRCR
jgi:homoaconitase/3-isopropylmalate dehydratase large subunit